MVDLAALTGQTRALRELLAWVTSSQTFVQPVARLVGPPGSGKTWVANELVTLVSGNITCVFARGASSSTGRHYAPLSSATMAAPRRSMMADLAPEVTRLAPRVGELLHFLTDYVLTRKESEQVRQTFALSTTEREILIRLERLAGRKRLLLILDDLHLWDEPSLSLIELMLSGTLNKPFQFLNDAAFLAISTSGATPSSRTYDLFTAQLTGPRVELSYCSGVDFGAVLIGLGLCKALDGTLAQELHKITRGDLTVARLLIDQLNEQSAGLQLLTGDTFDAFCERVVHARVRTAGPASASLNDVLACAAIIGPSFSRVELECLASDQARELLKCIGTAKELRLFEEHDATIQFVHDLYPRILKTRDPDRNRELHRRFVRCLIRIRPGDYWARARHYYEAGDLVSAHVAEIHGLLSDIREGRDGQLSRRYPLDARHDSLERFREHIGAMYRAYELSEYSRVIEMGEFVDPTLPPSLRAEAGYLIALCKTKSLLRTERADAIVLLEHWQEAVRTEPELWSRLSLARIITLGQMGAEKAMRAATEELVAQLTRSLDHDSGAHRTLYRLMLRADLIYRSDVAESRLVDSMNYFGPLDSGQPARDPLCYYIALTNFAGNQLCLSKYSTADRAAVECARYVRKVQGTIDAVRFPRLDVLANNYVMSAFRAKRISARRAATLLQAAISASPRSNDLPLLLSNAIGYDIIASRQPSLYQLEDWFSETFGREIEPYYSFFAGNNLSAAYLARGDRVRAREIWAAIGGLVGELDAGLREHMAQRQKRLDEALESVDCSVATCEQAIRSHPADALGPGWDHFAHVVLLSELQIWSDG